MRAAGLVPETSNRRGSHNGREDTRLRSRADLSAEGKTKRIWSLKGYTDLVELEAKDDITAGDGAKHDKIPDKGRFATQTTCNVFRLLKACGIRVAFIEQVSPMSFIAARGNMLPYEVVVRREVHGSALKRNPHLKQGHHFPKLVVEFYLKTSGKKWKDHDLICDDPYMVYREGGGKILLFDPKKPIESQTPFLELEEREVFGYEDEWKMFSGMQKDAREAFLVLEKAWQILGRKLVDFKIEFDHAGRISDVIDNDSWRVVEDGQYIDKQIYRDGADLNKVAAAFHHVSELTNRFGLPRQRIILWRGSDKDNFSAFENELGEANHGLLRVVTCSAHKEPIAAALILQQLVQEVPDCVVIAYIGRSNGAGPTLSANTTVPVITVPANAKDFPEDVWSSLRAPSKVPVMTVLEPANAIHAALQILSARNPRIYASLRSELEQRLVNVMHI